MTVDPTQNKPARRPRRALSEWGLPGVVLILAVILTLFSNVLETGGGKSSAFLNMGNLVTNVATPMSWMAIMAIGATFVIITAGIDISIGSIFCVSALACCATLQSLPPDASPWIVLPMAIGVAAGSGLVCGLVNGLLVVSLRIHPFIVTMGTLSIFRGITLISVPVKSLPSQGHELPGALTDFIGYKLTLPFDWTLFGFRLVEKGTYINPVPMLIMLACVVGAWIYLEHRVGGRELFAVGGNEEAARFSGLPVARIKLRVYALSGLMGGIAGFVSAGHYGSANTATGLGYELNVIAAAVVGGASMSGGRGSALGAMLGALVIKLIENGIDVIRSSTLVSQAPREPGVWQDHHRRRNHCGGERGPAEHVFEAAPRAAGTGTKPENQPKTGDENECEPAPREMGHGWRLRGTHRRACRVARPPMRSRPR